MPYCMQLTVIVIATLLGCLIAWKPKKAIKIQTTFYRLINWKMEPISMDKEIKNTRIMGLFLIIFAIAALIFIRTAK